MYSRCLVSVVDDDYSVRESLPDLLRSFGFAARAFASAKEFLYSRFVGRTDCLILDVSMPGMTGPALQRELRLRQHQIPIIFISADDQMRLHVIATGAVDCLAKPFSEVQLLHAVNTALRVS